MVRPIGSGEQIVNERVSQVENKQKVQDENLQSLVQQLNETQKALRSLQADVKAGQNNNHRALKILNQLAPKTSVGN